MTGQLFQKLRDNCGPSELLSEDEQRTYRMAALLHDVGHYPFSHTLERALKDHYLTSNIIQPVGTDAESTAAESPPMWLHEELGAHVINENDELSTILRGEGIDPAILAQIITRKTPPPLTNLVSSDLDADRIDYLMRTSLHTGLPYGRVDLDYLLSQIRLDNQQNLCFAPKGMRAAEHLLIARYFDYQQVSFHKTVQAFELALNDAIGALLRAGILDCTPTSLQAMLASENWSAFDDAHIMERLRAAALSGELDRRDQVVVTALLERRAPKLVLDREILGTDEDTSTFRSASQMVRRKLPEWEDYFQVPFWSWTQPGTRITKVASSVPLSTSAPTEAELYDKVAQSVRILNPDGTSSILQENRRSLIHILAERALFGLRVFALVPRDQDDLQARIEKRVNEDMLSLLT